jgi:hypothetical protein
MISLPSHLSDVGICHIADRTCGPGTHCQSLNLVRNLSYVVNMSIVSVIFPEHAGHNSFAYFLNPVNNGFDYFLNYVNIAVS